MNIVFSGVAALVAFLLFWFTVVKGPSLELVSSFEAIPWKSPPNTIFQMDAVLWVDKIEIMPIAFVFANGGSRSGAITNVDLEFVPSEEFKQFYRSIGIKVSVKAQDPQQSSDLPAIVSNGGTAIVWATMTIHLNPWKDLMHASQLMALPLDTAIKRVWDEGIVSLTKFMKFTESIGSVHLKVQRTKRQWGKVRVIEDYMGPLVQVGPTPDWLRDRAEKYLGRFGDLPPTDGEVARSIRGIPDFFINDVVKNIDTLKSNIATQTTGWLQTQGFDRLTYWNNSNDPAPRILDREKLSTQIANYYNEIAQFHDRLVGSSPDLRKNSPEMQALITLMNTLLISSENLLTMLTTLRQKLGDSTRFLLAG